MKTIVRITENDIRNMVNEVLSEMNYSTYKSAFDKMKVKLMPH